MSRQVQLIIIIIIIINNTIEKQAYSKHSHSFTQLDYHNNLHRHLTSFAIHHAFHQTLTAFLVSAALTTFASAYTIDSSVVARAAVSSFSKIKAKPATLTKATQFCKSGQSKRGLYSRAPWPPSAPAGFTPVAMGTYKGERYPLGLWTYGLVTCIGFGVTGTPKGPKGTSRFLMHFTTKPSMADAQVTPFAAAIKAAGLTNMKGWLSIPNTSSQTPEGWNADDKEPADMMAEGIEAAITHIVGKAPRIVTRPMAPAIAHTLPHGTMTIDKHDNVDIDGVRVTQ